VTSECDREGPYGKAMARNRTEAPQEIYIYIYIYICIYNWEGTENVWVCALFNTRV
jgi:hypothetical protein